MTDISTGVAAANLPYATPEELRGIALMAEQLNAMHTTWETSGYDLAFDDVAVYDGAGNRIAVLVWQHGADSFAVTLGG
jgi:hypothetical protein